MAAGTRRWRTICAIIKAEHQPCWLCGEPIDPALRWPHPYSFSGDHVIPTHHGGQDTYENARSSHLRCNCARHADDIATNDCTEPGL